MVLIRKVPAKPDPIKDDREAARKALQSFHFISADKRVMTLVTRIMVREVRRARNKERERCARIAEKLHHSITAKIIRKEYYPKLTIPFIGLS